MTIVGGRATRPALVGSQSAPTGWAWSHRRIHGMNAFTAGATLAGPCRRTRLLLLVDPEAEAQSAGHWGRLLSEMSGRCQPPVAPEQYGGTVASREVRLAVGQVVVDRRRGVMAPPGARGVRSRRPLFRTLAASSLNRPYRGPIHGVDPARDHQTARHPDADSRHRPDGRRVVHPDEGRSLPGDQLPGCL